MKVTRLGRTRPVIGISTIIGGSGGSAGTGLVATGSNGGTEFRPIIYGVSADGASVLGPFVNLAAGSNITLTRDSGPGGSMPSNTIRIHSTGGGAIDYGEDADISTLDFSDTPSAGVSTEVARSDHVHGMPADPGGGGGGGASGYDLDTYTLDGTYGDDFTGASLSGSWTRRNFTSGAETYQQGKNATYMRIVTTSRSAGDGYFRPAPGGDWTIAMKLVQRWANHPSRSALAPCVVDSSGNGVAVQVYDSPNALLIIGLSSYAYSGSFQQATSWAGAQSMLIEQHPHWLRLRKSGTTYFGAVSFDGEIWTPETPSFSWTGTVDRIGMIAPLGFGGSSSHYIDVDWFNKIG